MTTGKPGLGDIWGYPEEWVWSVFFEDFYEFPDPWELNARICYAASNSGRYSKGTKYKDWFPKKMLQQAKPSQKQQNNLMLSWAIRYQQPTPK